MGLCLSRCTSPFLPPSLPASLLRSAASFLLPLWHAPRLLPAAPARPIVPPLLLLPVLSPPLILAKLAKLSSPPHKTGHWRGTGSSSSRHRSASLITAGSLLNGCTEKASAVVGSRYRSDPPPLTDSTVYLPLSRSAVAHGIRQASVVGTDRARPLLLYCIPTAAGRPRLASPPLLPLSMPPSPPLLSLYLYTPWYNRRSVSLSVVSVQ